MSLVPTILETIATRRKQHIQGYYERYDLKKLNRRPEQVRFLFSGNLKQAKKQGEPALIAEFKRKSPSEDNIALQAQPEEVAQHYVGRGAKAISVLCEPDFFAGAYEDMERVAHIAHRSGVAVLCKDFILDPIQIRLAKAHGADAILLIAALLDKQQIQEFALLAEELGMDVLTEVHNEAEYQQIEALQLPILGVNNRNLHNFHIGMCNTVYLSSKVPEHTLLVSESGYTEGRQVTYFQHVADAFLIGTGLMRKAQAFDDLHQQGPPLFKACGIRQADLREGAPADYFGFNFSPVSKRSVDEEALKGFKASSKDVAVFYQNSWEEVVRITEGYGFGTIQVYELPPEWVLKRLKVRLFFALKAKELNQREYIDQAAQICDYFIVDSNQPGSGQAHSGVPSEFPFPFFLAGGMHLENLSRCMAHPRCVGVDMASGIEEDGQVRKEKIVAIAQKLQALQKEGQPHHKPIEHDTE